MRTQDLNKAHSQAVETIKQGQGKDRFGNNPHVTIQLVGLLLDAQELRKTQSDTFVLEHLLDKIERKLKPAKSANELPEA